MMSGANFRPVCQYGALAVARLVGLRQRQRRNAEHRGLHRAGDGAGIDHVLAGIAAAIDAGEHQIGHLVLEQMPHAHDDAIGRRAAHREAALLDLAQPQRIVERQRMGDAGLIEFRRDDPDIVGQLARDLFADIEPFGVNAVVVGDEDAHAYFSIFFMPPMYGASASGTAIEPSSCW